MIQGAIIGLVVGRTGLLARGEVVRAPSALGPALLATLLAIGGCAPPPAALSDAGPSVDANVARDGGPSVPYAPLVCDPSRAGELAFGVHANGAFFAPADYVANGTQFLFVDHACQWWAQRYSPLEVRTGMLDDATLAALNAELLTAPWSAVDGERVEGCCDGDTTFFGRDDVRASHYQGVLGGSDRLLAIEGAANDWIGRLSTMGAPMTGGRVRLELRVVTTTAAAPIAWPLGTPMADALGGATVRAVVLEGADADTLRATRMGAFQDGSLLASFLVVDTLPFADADGCLRPLGGETCRFF